MNIEAFRSIESLELASEKQGNDFEFSLSDSDFDRISKKIYQMTGIVIPSHKRQMIYSRLARRLRATNKKSFSDYLNFIDTVEGKNESESFTNAVTTNITSFFREQHHFIHLEQEIENDISKKTDPLMLWSAGCSSGQEPYSMAMTVHEILAKRLRSYRILATDLDTTVLAKAKQGRYELAKKVEIGEKYQKYVLECERNFEIDKTIRSNVFFRRLNLFEKLPFEGSFDYIFCRNVLIYFDVKHKKRVIEKLVGRLRVGGCLFLGHSESLFEDVPTLRSRGKTTYEKIE